MRRSAALVGNPNAGKSALFNALTGARQKIANYPGVTVEQCQKWAAMRVEALNHALRDIPPEKVRFHTCYSINMGPRIHDMELKDVVAIILKIRAGAYSFEAANPRHQHEWRVWQEITLPAGTRTSVNDTSPWPSGSS